MPFGVDDALWALLPEQDRQQIIAEYESTQLQTVDVPETGGPYTSPGGEPIDPLDATLLDPDYWKAVLDVASGSPYTTGELLGLASGYYSPIADVSTDVGGGGFVTQSPFQLSPGVPASAVFSEIDLPIAGAPEWWKALAPDVYNPASEYQTFANLLIPFLSPEDQRITATNLYQSAPEQFSYYNPELLSQVAPPQEITPELRSRFFTGERAQDTLDAFDRLLDISGKSAEDFGPGYNFLRGIADTFRDFELTSGARQLTETQQGQLLSSLDPLLAQTESGPLSAFGPIARSYANPFFSAGSLTGQVRNQYGDVIASPNPAFR